MNCQQINKWRMICSVIGKSAPHPSDRRLRALIALIGMMICSIAWRGQSAGTTSASLILQWTHQSQFAGYYVALEKGFYLKRGLNVEILRGGPDRNPADYLPDNRAQFMTTFLTGALVHRDKGAALVNIAQIVNRSTLMLIAWKNRGIKSAADLQGRRVSLWGGDFRAPFLGFFKANSIEPVIIPQNYTTNLFLRGGADACAAMYYNEYDTIRQSGVNEDEITTFFMRDHGFDLPEDGIYCLESMTRSHPDACAAMAAASMEGWRHALDHRDEALDITMKYVNESNLPTNRTHMKWMLDKILEAIFPRAGDDWQAGVITARAYDKAAALLKQQGLVGTVAPYERFRWQGGANAQ